MAIKPSPRFTLCLLGMHALGALVVYATEMPLAVRVAIIILFAVSLSYHLLRDEFLLLPDSWRDVSLDRGFVQVVVRDGSSFRAQVDGTTIVSPYLIVFRVKMDGFRSLVSRVIFPDALDADEFRQLCVDLRFT
jgi:toxin CptA